MKFLKKLKSSNFWVSMISAVVLILQAVFNVEIKTEYLNQIIMSILGLLVMSGIVTDAGSDEVTVKQNVDIDGIKQNVGEMISQATQTLENNLSALTKQFVETAKVATQQQVETPKTEIMQEVVATEQAVVAENAGLAIGNTIPQEQMVVQPNIEPANENQNV